MMNVLRLVTFVLCALGTTVGHAATLRIDPVYLQSFDSSMAPLGSLAGNGGATPVGGFLQFELRMTLLDAFAGEDFWIAIFDLHLGPGLAVATDWMSPATAQSSGFYPSAPNLGFYDSNGPALGGVSPHWEYGNADFGANAHDLLGIIVEASAAESASRQYGEAARPGAGSDDGLGFPTLIGGFLATRTDLSTTSISVTPIAGAAWGLYTSNHTGDGDFLSQASNRFTGSTLNIVPEPSVAVLWASATLMLLIVYRRAGRLRCRLAAGMALRIQA